LLIRSTPADADVLVNGTPRGKTPLTVRDLPFGSYTIRIAREGYAVEERKLQLTAERPAASMIVTLLGEGGRQAASPGTTGLGGLTVQSRPAGARVFVNDRLIGSTPLAVPNLPARPTTVRIEMDGYRTWITTVRVNAGEQARVGASLEKR
jgi:PEGA domain-containing protein